MSDDVDRVLRDYIQVMDQKDNDAFKVLQRNAELEGLLVSCREKLLHQDELIKARQDEKQGLVDELRERHLNVVAMDEELSSLRKFIRSVRKLLVMDDAAKFSLAEVLHVLCARLEDYGVVARAYQLQSQQFQKASSDWQAMLFQIESEHRKTLQVLCAESDDSFRDMLASATQTVSIAHSERDAAVAAADASVARSAKDAKTMVDNVTTEVARLRSHVDELLRESSATRDARDAAKAALVVATQTAEQQRCSYDTLLQTAHLAIGTAHRWGEEVVSHRGDLLEAFARTMRASADTQMASFAEARSLSAVNESLREQLSKISRVHASDKRRWEAAKTAASQESETALGEAQQQVIDLRRRLSAATTKEQTLQEKLHDAHAQLTGVLAVSEQAEERSRDATVEVHRLERLLHHRAKENGELKQLLSALQERSAQVRQLVADGDQRRAKVEKECEELRGEVTALHLEHRRAKECIERTECALREKSSELTAAQQAMNREQTAMSAERDQHAWQCRRFAEGENELKASLAAAEQRAKDSAADRDNLAADVTRLTRTISSLEATLADERHAHEAVVARLTTSLSIAQQRVGEVEAELAVATAAVNETSRFGKEHNHHHRVVPTKRVGSESVPGISQSPQRSDDDAVLSKTGSAMSSSSSPLSSCSGDDDDEATADDLIAAIQVSMLQREAGVCGDSRDATASSSLLPKSKKGAQGGGGGGNDATADKLRAQLAAMKTACEMSVEEVAHLRQELQLSLLARPPSSSSSGNNRSVRSR